ncbi:F0F1 ATP synthase subunit delta [Enterocloster asparagiformis]|uniref:ATP synthase F1 subunit delta n=1 Tax=Enterocloster asparagiformis TaxID=333367 RepID=UPI0034A9D7B4
MNQTAINYATALYELSIPGEAVDETDALFAQAPQLRQVLSSPVTSLKEKHAAIVRIFPPAMQNFLKELCDNQDADRIGEILEAYRGLCLEKNGILRAELRCAVQPTGEQLEQMTARLCRKYHKSDVRWTIRHDPSLIGGFVIRVGDVESDWSLKGRLKQLQQKLMWR